MVCALVPGAESPLCAGEDAIRVKHVLQGAVYLEVAGAPLSVGQRLVIGRSGKAGTVAVAEIEIESVAAASAVGRVITSSATVVPGDRAYLDRDEMGRTAPATAREPDANRVRGRLGVDWSALQVPGEGVGSSQLGFMLRMDAGRLGGTHWSVKGHYRGRVQSRKDSTRRETLTDLINRTYHLGLQYDNPDSPWVAGAGRLYVPWAASLSTIDGFYLGRRFGKQTAGVFGGTTPDPSSWDYNPDRQLAGAFVNTERGSFESFRFTGTAGVALARVDWKPDRQFGFFENGIFYQRHLSVHNNLEVDLRNASQNSGSREILLTRSHTTVRVQPHKAVTFNLSQNYFRNLPTFDPRLIGTGLVDRFLFQGLSGGFRLALPHRVSVFGNAGKSSRTGDRRAAWNYLGGAGADDIFGSGLQAEYRYSKFDSSFGRGTYQTAGFVREVGTNFRFDVRLGRQNLDSAYTTRSRARFVNANADWYLGSRYFLGGGVSVYRGQGEDYNQYFLTLGYRFDNRR
jgi:hypothetical protein